MPKKYRSNAFTLMEVILSITLIGIIATVISMRGRELFLFYNQQSNIELFKNEIELTEQIAKMYNTDIDLHIEPGESGLILRRTYYDQLLQLDYFLQKVVVIDSVSLVDHGDTKINEVITYHFSRTGKDKGNKNYRCK